MEVERNLQDAMNVARNVMVDARLVPGGGATEMAMAYVSCFCYCDKLDVCGPCHIHSSA